MLACLTRAVESRTTLHDAATQWVLVDIFKPQRSVMQILESIMTFRPRCWWCQLTNQQLTTSCCHSRVMRYRKFSRLSKQFTTIVENKSNAEPICFLHQAPSTRNIRHVASRLRHAYIIMCMHAYILGYDCLPNNYLLFKLVFTSQAYWQACQYSDVILRQ